LPVAPYRRMPRGSLIGTDLKRKEYFIGFYIMFLMVDFAVFRPAILVKSNIWVVLTFLGLVKFTACFTKAPKVSD
jgi:hypothetical protein